MSKPANQGRRNFLRNLAAGAALMGAAAVPGKATAQEKSLTLWSCGGLAEGLIPAHEDYSAKTGIPVSYTGARASSLGKSLLDGAGRTDVFCGRQLGLAQKLRQAGKMAWFKPFCYSTYVIITPQGNPYNIRSLEDMAKPGMRIAMAPFASPPGGQAVTNILKSAGLLDQVMANVIDPNATCVLRTTPLITNGKAAAMIVERRITKFPRFQPLDVVEIPYKFQPKGPMVFTAGLMTDARDKQASTAFLEWLIGPEGGAHMENAGFIPAMSERGQELTELLGVKDDAN